MYRTHVAELTYFERILAFQIIFIFKDDEAITISQVFMGEKYELRVLISVLKYHNS